MTEHEQEESNMGNVRLDTHPLPEVHTGHSAPTLGIRGHESGREEAQPLPGAPVTIYNILYFIYFSCLLSLSLLEQKPKRTEILHSTWRTSTWHTAGAQVANTEWRNQHCFLERENYFLGLESYSLSIWQIHHTRLPLSRLLAPQAGPHTFSRHAQASYPLGAQTQTPLGMQGALSIITGIQQECQAVWGKL